MAVIVLAALTIGLTASDVVIPWHPYGVANLVMSHHQTVVAVKPNSDVAVAGVRVGDRVLFDHMSLHDRLASNGAVFFGNPGSHLRLETLSPSGVRRSVIMGVTMPQRTLADNLTNFVECASSFVSVVVAAALVMLRPRRSTGAFFVFVVLSLSLGVTPMLLDVLALNVAWTIIGPLTALAWIPLTIFALRFPNDTPGPAGRRFERVLLASLVGLGPIALYPTILKLFGVALPGLAYAAPLRTVLPPFGLLLAAGVFFIRYRAAMSPERTRMRWVIAGFLAGYAGFVVQPFLIQISHDYSGVLSIGNLLRAAPVCAPLAVGYAIVRYRVLDVRIVVRRAAVYAMLTATVVALVAVIDLLVSKIFEGTKIAALGEIGVAIILGLTLNPLHRRLESAVDAAIFRHRRNGQERLRQVADGLMYARTSTAISHVLVRESIDAFGLASAAVFEATDGGNYTLATSAGWDTAPTPAIDHDCSLVLRLFGSRAPLRIAPGDLAAVPGVPADLHAPALAVPIVFRGELDGFILFGAHSNGEEIDAEELASLWALARSAASAYDHLDAQVMRAELAAFKLVAADHAAIAL